MELKKQKVINKDLVVYCLNNFMLSLCIAFIVLPYIILPESFVFFTFFNVFLFYFLKNSFKVYVFRENGLSLKYRFFKKIIININYDELDEITFNYIISPHSSHSIAFTLKRKSKQILPTISMQNWNEVENLITFFKNKDVKLIINK